MAFATSNLTLSDLKRSSVAEPTVSDDLGGGRRRAERQAAVVQRMGAGLGPGVGERAVEEGRVAAPCLGPVVQVPQLHAQHRGLNGIETAVEADDLVVVLRPCAVHAENAQQIGDRFVGGRADAALMRVTQRQVRLSASRMI